VRDHRTYALQTVQQTYVRLLDVRYFFKYPVVNTWTYEVAFGALGKNHRMYARVRRTFAAFQGVGGSSPINSPYPSSFFTLFRHPQAANVCFVSICEVLVCFGAFVKGNSCSFTSRK
jgi:hypothetical protein